MPDYSSFRIPTSAEAEFITDINDNMTYEL
jgi:hypothetical protein